MRYFILAFLLLGFSSYAQPTISKQVIGPAGATYENGNNKLSYTAGEVVVGAMTSEDGSIQLGNGYYPSLDLTILTTQTPQLQLQVKVYPNPARNSITVESKNATIVSIQIMDAAGRIVRNVEHQNLIDVGLLPSGTYYAKIFTLDGRHNSIKFHKL